MSDTKEPMVDCFYCHGSGKIAEEHDWATEWLACLDCDGKGQVPESWVEADQDA